MSSTIEIIPAVFRILGAEPVLLRDASSPHSATGGRRRRGRRSGTCRLFFLHFGYFVSCVVIVLIQFRRHSFKERETGIRELRSVSLIFLILGFIFGKLHFIIFPHLPKSSSSAVSLTTLNFSSSLSSFGSYLNLRGHFKMINSCNYINA